ncbi:MAG: N-acetyltransferase family protein [Dissulfurispiraceae bacterium]|jgi:GNAT superfamily N-acetyltransferase
MASSAVGIEISKVQSRRDLLDFIELPLSLYRGDELYSPELTHDLKVHFSPKNPFFKDADVEFFLARKNGKIAGRIASIVNHLHLSYQKESAGFFGFFESINDPEVAKALLDTVSEVLKGKGIAIMRGPMNFSTNDECGFLIEGFEEAPLLMTPYNFAYYNNLMEECGLGKAKDLHAYIYNVEEELPEKILRVAAIAEKRGITVRQVTKDYFMEAMRGFREVYNSAWKHNWGFIPMSVDELDYGAKRLKPIVVPDMTIVAEKDGEAVGFLGMLPDFNFVLRKMHGKLNPITLAKALYYSRKIRDLRMLLLGIKPEYRNKGVDGILFREAFKGVKRGKYRRVEFSWILEDNINVIRLVEMIGGKLYKKYRIYERKVK